MIRRLACATAVLATLATLAAQATETDFNL
jgi:hypothetical protein